MKQFLTEEYVREIVSSKHPAQKLHDRLHEGFRYYIGKINELTEGGILRSDTPMLAAALKMYAEEYEKHLDPKEKEVMGMILDSHEARVTRRTESDDNSEGRKIFWFDPRKEK